MNHFLVIRIIDSLPLISSVKIYNDVEINKYDNLFKYEKKAIAHSLNSHNENLQITTAQVLSCIVEAETIEIADDLAEQKITTIIDNIEAYSLGICFSQLKKSRIIKNLETNELFAAEDSSAKYPITVIKSTTYGLDYIGLQLLNHNSIKDELIRLSHWLRISKGEKNLHIKILQYWIALEGFLKINDNDNIVNRMMQIAGFIVGRLGSSLNNDFRKEYVEVNNYKKMKKKAENMLDNIRKTRNNTVHYSIETYSDLYSENIEKLNLLDYISEMLRVYLMKALKEDIYSKKDFWDAFPGMFMEINANKDIDFSSIFTNSFQFELKKYKKISK